MITINGEVWGIRLVSPHHPMLFTREGKPAIGCCDDITKTIYISNILSLDFMKKVICHELVHAVMYSYDVMIDDYTEEIVADIFTKYGEEIIRLTHITYNKMLGWKI